MPQLIGLVLAGAALWAGYRWLRKETRRVEAELNDAEQALKRGEEKAIPTLKRDPETGVYRPSRD